MHYPIKAARYSWCSRAFIRAIAEDPDLPVPSPTYLLQNTYDEHDGGRANSLVTACRHIDCMEPLSPCPDDLACHCTGPPVHHFDLYRLAGPAELGRLQMEDAFMSGICLIEWADRLGSSALPDTLEVHIQPLSEVWRLPQCRCHVRPVLAHCCSQ